MKMERYTERFAKIRVQRYRKTETMKAKEEAEVKRLAKKEERKPLCSLKK
jgi:hypothetical protein